MKVKGPVTKLMDMIPARVPRLLINNQVVSYQPEGANSKKRKLEEGEKLTPVFSAALIGPCDDVVQYICESNEWTSLLTVAEKKHLPAEKYLEAPPAAPKVSTYSECTVSLRRSNRAKRPKIFSDLGHESMSLKEEQDLDESVGLESQTSGSGQNSGEIKTHVYEFEADPALDRVFRLREL